MSGRSGQGVLQSDFFSTAAKVPRRDSPSARQLPAGTSTPVTLESLRQLAQSMGLGASAAVSAGGTGGKKKKAGGKKKKGKAKKKNGKGKSDGKNAATSLDAPTTDDPHTSGATDGVAAGTTEQGLAQPSGSGHSAPSVANFVATGPGDEFAAAARRELRRASQRVEAMVIPRLECGCVRRAALGQQFIVHHCGMDKIRVPGRRDMSAQRAPVLGGEAVAARAVDLTVASDFGMESPHSTVLLTQDMATQMVLKCVRSMVAPQPHAVPALTSTRTFSALLVFRYTLVLENLEVLLPEHAEVFCRRATLLHILQCFEDARMDAVHALELDHDYPAVGVQVWPLQTWACYSSPLCCGLPGSFPAWHGFICTSTLHKRSGRLPCCTCAWAVCMKPSV